MSFEGHFQLLCEDGHYSTCDCTDDETQVPCYICGKKMVWFNIVDNTNGDDDCMLDMNKFLFKPETREICNLGYEHIIEHNVYKIPNDVGNRIIRT